MQYSINPTTIINNNKFELSNSNRSRQSPYLNNGEKKTSTCWSTQALALQILQAKLPNPLYLKLPHLFFTFLFQSSLNGGLNLEIWVGEMEETQALTMESEGEEERDERERGKSDWEENCAIPYLISAKGTKGCD